MRIYILFIVIFLVKCHDKKIVKRQIGNEIVVSNFGDDTLFNGETIFYSLDGKLKAKIFYKKGIKNGPSINYYSNGRINDSVFFENGKEKGKYFFYDSSGMLNSVGNYFNGKMIGGREFYSNGHLIGYDFVDLDEKPLFSIFYDKINIPERYQGDIINFSFKSLPTEKTTKYELKLYTIFPPSFKIDYSLGIYKNSSKKLDSDSRLFNPIIPIVDTVLSDLPKGWSYFIKADFLDSSNGFHKIFIQPIILNSD